MTLTEAYNATLADARHHTAQDFWERVAFKMGVGTSSFHNVRKAAMAAGLPPVRPAKHRASATINTAMQYNRETRRERA
jgi:hypothetical protein